MHRPDGCTKPTDTWAKATAALALGLMKERTATDTGLTPCDETRQAIPLLALLGRPFATGINTQPVRLIATSRIRRPSWQMRSGQPMDGGRSLAIPPQPPPGGPERQVSDLEPGYFLCIARFCRTRTCRSWPKRLGTFPDARLVIVGDGPARSDIETRRRPKRPIPGPGRRCHASLALSKLAPPSSPPPSKTMASPHWRQLPLVALGSPAVWRLSRHGRGRHNRHLLRFTGSRQGCLRHEHGHSPNLGCRRNPGPCREVLHPLLPAQDPAGRGGRGRVQPSTLSRQTWSLITTRFEPDGDVCTSKFSQGLLTAAHDLHPRLQATLADDADDPTVHWPMAKDSGAWRGQRKEGASSAYSPC